MKTIYISGKITGIESEAVRLFAVAQTELAIKGYNTVNPMHLRHDHDKKWTSYMKVCIKALCDCDGIYLLSNWKRSKGAWVEFLLAKILKIKRVK